MADLSAVESIFFAALEKPSDEERAAFLNAACGGDAELRNAVHRHYGDALARLVKLGGMSRGEFDNCLKNTPLENKIVETRLIASKELDVNSTPTFFINGTKFAGAPTVEEFDKVLSGLSPKS